MYALCEWPHNVCVYIIYSVHTYGHTACGVLTTDLKAHGVRWRDLTSLHEEPPICLSIYRPARCRAPPPPAAHLLQHAVDIRCELDELGQRLAPGRDQIFGHTEAHIQQIHGALQRTPYIQAAGGRGVQEGIAERKGRRTRSGQSIGLVGPVGRLVCRRPDNCATRQSGAR
jgi:hypothetical protein